MGNDVNFGNLARSSAKKPEYKEKLQQAAKDVSARKSSGSINASSVTHYSAVKIQGSSNLNVRDNSIFGNKNGIDAKEFSDMWAKSATAENLTVEQQNTLKAQNDLLTALADEDGDGMITQEEAERLDVAGDDGVITDEDIQEIYKSLNISPDDATIDDLLNAIDGILNDAAIEEIEDAKNKEAAKEQGINLDNSGVKRNEDGTYSVTVETYRDGKVQEDGDVKRYSNGSFWGIVTNAYPEISEADKEKVYEMIGEMNDFDWNNHVLHTGDELKMPILEYDENGRVTGYHAESEVKEAEEKSTDSKYTIPEEGTLETKQGTVSKDEDGKYTITLQHGVEVSCVYDESTGEVTIPNAEKSDKPGTYGYSYSVEMRNGEKVTVEPDQGKYYINGVQVDGVKMDENGNLSFQTDIVEKVAEETNDYRIDHTGSASGEGEAADGSTVTWYQGKYYVDGYQVEYDEKTGIINNNKYRINHTGSASGEGKAADDSTVTWYQGKYYDENGNHINYDERTGIKTPIEESTPPTSSTPSTATTAGTTTTDINEKLADAQTELENMIAKGTGRDDLETIQYLTNLMNNETDFSVEDRMELLNTFNAQCNKYYGEEKGLPYSSSPDITGEIMDLYSDMVEEVKNGNMSVDEVLDNLDNLGDINGDPFQDYVSDLGSTYTSQFINSTIELYKQAEDNGSLQKVLEKLPAFDVIQDMSSGGTETQYVKDLMNKMNEGIPSDPESFGISANRLDELDAYKRGINYNTSNDSMEKILDAPESELSTKEKMYLMQELYGLDGRISLDQMVSNFRDTGFFGSRNDNQEEYLAKWLKLYADYSSQA